MNVVFYKLDFSRLATAEKAEFTWVNEPFSAIA
jgi:hypothetical protein